jgi:hypothetical protein
MTSSSSLTGPAAKEFGRDHVHTLISALRGQDRGGQQLKGRLMIQGTERFRIRFGQLPDDLADTLLFVISAGFVCHKSQNSQTDLHRPRSDTRARILLNRANSIAAMINHRNGPAF